MTGREGNAIPRIIWSLWLQGWNNAPDVVRASAATWVRFNPGWDIRRLTQAHVVQLLSPQPRTARLLALDMPPEALSNMVRLELLERCGGVWTDATTYCLRPLDDWLTSAAPQGFFAFDRPGPDRMISTWFLAAAPASPVITKWRVLAENYWRERAVRHTYFWCHGLFAEAYHADPLVRCIWDATPKHSAHGPHAFLPYDKVLAGPAIPARQAIVETAAQPLLKLTHKLPPGAIDAGTLCRWLCDRTQDAQLNSAIDQAWQGRLGPDSSAIDAPS